MNLHQLDCADPEALAGYERAFYTAFSRAKANTLVRRLWHWDDSAGRIRTRIPYADQVVFLLRDPVEAAGADAVGTTAKTAVGAGLGAVDTAVSLNYRLAEHQSAILGFAPPAPLAGHCEILALFSRRDADLSGLRNFMRTAAQRALALGLKTADATCTDRLLPVYRHIGGQPLDTATIDGERRTRLRFKLETMAQLERLT
ncbi:MAG: hypothetical protein NTV57_02125 [Cyanobacteria bacterium]|nr:hypothetical protein [Cyanobacteriota bacterium]